MRGRCPSTPKKTRKQPDGRCPVFWPAAVGCLWKAWKTPLGLRTLSTGDGTAAAPPGGGCHVFTEKEKRKAALFRAALLTKAESGGAVTSTSPNPAASARGGCNHFSPQIHPAYSISCFYFFGKLPFTVLLAPTSACSAILCQ